MPKLSIITINYNNAAGLKETMDSVFAQNFTDKEYLVIDGGSTDESKAVIEAAQDKLAYWVSEKDKGIYHAMNKGIAKATGEYLLFLNSGDHFSKENALKNLFRQSNGEDLIYGDLIFVQGTNNRPCIFPDELNFSFFLQEFNSLPHAATLIKSTLFTTVGHYNETLKIVSDWAFFILAVNRYNASYKHVKEFITIFNLDGISAQNDNYDLIVRERKQVLQQYFPTFLKDYEGWQQDKKSIQKIHASIPYRMYRKVKKVFPGK